MGLAQFTIVISYDISSPLVRRRVAALLEDAMARVQLSVFEARMNMRQAQALFDAVAALLEEDDSLRMYVLDANAVRRSRTAGGAPLPEDGGWWLL